jgi:outer membrane biosynthesis protein TonB
MWQLAEEAAQLEQLAAALNPLTSAAGDSDDSGGGGGGGAGAALPGAPFMPLALHIPSHARAGGLESVATSPVDVAAARQLLEGELASLRHHRRPQAAADEREAPGEEGRPDQGPAEGPGAGQLNAAPSQRRQPAQRQGQGQQQQKQPPPPPPQPPQQQPSAQEKQQRRLQPPQTQQQQPLLPERRLSSPPRSYSQQRYADAAATSTSSSGSEGGRECDGTDQAGAHSAAASFQLPGQQGSSWSPPPAAAAPAQPAGDFWAGVRAAPGLGEPAAASWEAAVAPREAAGAPREGRGRAGADRQQPVGGLQVVAPGALLGHMGAVAQLLRESDDSGLLLAMAHRLEALAGPGAAEVRGTESCWGGGVLKSLGGCLAWRLLVLVAPRSHAVCPPTRR